MFQLRENTTVADKTDPTPDSTAKETKTNGTPIIKNVKKSKTGNNMSTKDATKYFTLQQVEQHRTGDDCWTIVDNRVYDLSRYVRHHPGGPLIMNAAGSDATVLFHTSHTYGPIKAQKVLAKYQIGVLKECDETEIRMGPFYKDCAERVRLFLQDKPRRPLLAQIYYVLDALVVTILPLLGLFYLDRHTTPLWVLLLVHVLSPVHVRATGQAHGTGHGQIWDILSWKRTIAEWYQLVWAFPGSIAFGMALNQEQNDRRLLNRPRSVSQYEYGGGVRGFAEHVAIHHVKGTDLEHDECAALARLKFLFRLDCHERYIPWLHSHQIRFWYQCVVDSIGDGIYCGKLFQMPEHVLFAIQHLLPRKQFGKALAIILGAIPSIGCAGAYFCLPFSTQPYAWQCFVLLTVVREYLGCMAPQVFFAQHVWDNSVPEERSNEEWGIFNAETSYSWWPDNSWDLLYQPVLWCFPFVKLGRGASSSTLSYHLEHTLFPCVNYLYLPQIAPIVRQCCQDHGITYNGLYGRAGLKKARQDMLQRHAKHKTV